MKIFDNRPDIKSMFHRLNKEHFGGEIPGYSGRLEWSNDYHGWILSVSTNDPNASRRHSLCEGPNRALKIDLSDKLFKSLGYDLQKIERTLIHEMVHAYLVHKYDEKGHTARFQRMMTQITGENINHRCHNYDISEVRREARYTLICHRCGHEHGMSRKPKHPYYKHRKCGGKMTLRWPSRRCVGGTKGSESTLSLSRFF